MEEHYTNYITWNIKDIYKRKLITPFIYIAIIIILGMLYPFSDILFPDLLIHYSQVETNFRNGNAHIRTELSDLYFTGYTSVHYGKTTGYYYYTIWEDTCLFVLLSPSTCEEGLPLVENVHIKARILHQGKIYDQLTGKLANDLLWTSQGMKSKISGYILSEPAFRNGTDILLMIVYFSSGIFAFLTIIAYVLYILYPVFSPPCRQLGPFGQRSSLLAQAEEELKTLLRLTTEDIFITEHFFIGITSTGIVIVPIGEILWIYKHSTLHKLFWYHFRISYTLHITAGRYSYIHCPKDRKMDIDAVIDYLLEANHNILVGLNEENRLKIQEIRTPAIRFETLLSLLKRWR